MPSIIQAGDASNGLVVASGNDGAVVIQSGLAGAKVDAITIAANGTVTIPLNTINFTATGGTITNSGGYTIHTFTTSGTFTPNKNGNVDYLVVAGGAGGGAAHAGGGGAGGFLTATSFSVNLAGLTVTVGAGGAGSTSNQARGTIGMNLL